MKEKSIREIIKEELINEISSDLADAAFRETAAFEGKNAVDIFKDEDRVVIPMNYGVGAYTKIKKEMKKKGYDLDFENGLAKQVVQTKVGEKIRTIKIDKALQKELKNEIKRDPSQESFTVKQLLRKDGKSLLKKYAEKYPELVELTKDENSESLFKGWYRTRTYTLEDLISAAWGWEIDYEGKIVKSNAGGVVKAIPGMYGQEKIQKIKKALAEIGEELKEIGFIENGQDNRGSFVQAYDEYKQVGSGYVIVVSRAPIDLLRMSDFQNIQSCHSEGGSYFHCAIQESESGGAVAYLVKKEEIEGVSMMKREIFSDSKRGISGIKPIARLRLRRMSYIQNEEEGQIIVPELRTYGMRFDEFYETINHWSHKVQSKNFEQDDEGNPIYPERFELKGGSYSDNQPHALLNAWAGKRIANHETVVSGEGLSEQIESIADDIRQNYGAEVEWDEENFAIELDYQIVGLYELDEESSLHEEIVSRFYQELEHSFQFLTIELDADNGDINVSSSINCGDDMDAGLQMVTELSHDLHNFDEKVGYFIQRAERQIEEYFNREGLSDEDLERFKKSIIKILQVDDVKDAKVRDKQFSFVLRLGSDFQKSAFSQALSRKYSIIEDFKSEIGRHHAVRDLVKHQKAEIKFYADVGDSCFVLSFKISTPNTMDEVNGLIENLDALFRYNEEIQDISNSLIKDVMGSYFEDEDDDDDY